MKIIFLTLITVSLFAGDNNPKRSFYYDIQNFQDSVKSKSKIYEQQKISPKKAGFYSAILPGSGEFLSQNYYQSLFFLSTELIAITSFYINNTKGDDQTSLFKKYANENWSVVKYAEWLNKNGAKYGDAATININPNTSLSPWERINWDELNAWEANPHSIGFTHVLPAYGSQQYYELIGKYLQYKYGWKTFQFNGDPLGDDNYSTDVSQEIKDYMLMRGKANDFYKVATYFSFAILVNHIASGLNAAWQANSFNNSVDANVSYSFDRISGKPISEISLKIKL